MIKKVLVYAFGSQSHENTIRAAAMFATQYGAELKGVFVKPNYLGYSTFYGEQPINLAQRFYALQTEFAEIAKQEFTDLTKGFGCKSDWCEIDEYDESLRLPIYSDYIFVNKPVNDGLVFSETDFVDHLILKTGLPTIIIPPNWGGKTFARRPILGWKETKEAINAVRHCLPLMRGSEGVNIVTVTAKKDLDTELIQGVKISEYLSAHQISCKYHNTRVLPDENDEAQSLIRYAGEHYGDLLIIGGYGHSRFQQLVLGGVTRQLLKNSPIPLLLAH